jgi:16S rRNA (cytosine1407-C5)-methyltransferase
LQHSILPADLKDGDLFLSTLIEIYGQDTAESILSQMSARRVLGFWRNPLVECDVVPAELGTELPELGGVWVREYDNAFTHSQAVSSGALYIQNPSSVLAVRVLNPQPDEEILDLAAAPGGKALAIAAMMGNTGRLAAVEPVRGRFHKLAANLKRCGVTNVALYQRDGRGVGRTVGERFDRVLLDAPCSSQTRMRWDAPTTYQHWSARKIKESQRKQKSLLRSAFAALKPGGTLVYSTCSFAPEENELVVAHLLKRDSTAQVQPFEVGLSNVVPGLTAWHNKALDESLQLTRRIVPHSAWDGFYIARLTKRVAVSE